MTIGNYLPYRFLWSYDEEWLQSVLAAERYDLLKKPNEGENENEIQ